MDDELFLMGDPREGNMETRAKCGFMCIQPMWLEKYATIKVFVGVFSYFTLSYVMMEMYLLAIITTIEKRFGLTSSQSGMLLSIRELAYLCTALLVSHFAHTSYRPRVLALAGIIGGLGGFVYLLPHFMFDVGDGMEIVTQNTTADQKYICQMSDVNSSTEVSEMSCSTVDSDGLYQKGALILFAFGSILMGCTNSCHGPLSTTYVDDACSTAETAFYLGVIKSMSPLGPMLGFLLGGLFISLPENLTDPGYDSSDPRWVGAWWLGYLIIPIIFMGSALLLPFFPRRLTPKSQSTKQTQTKDIHKEISCNSFLEFARTLWRLLCNPAYVLFVAGGCFSAFVISGFFPFIPKYMETQFFLTASVANLLTGCVATLLAGAGIFLGGLITSKFRWEAKHASIFIVVMNYLFVFIVLLLMITSCEQPPIVGINENSEMVNLSCASDCDCSLDAFSPVCGSDGITYRTPCHAGCTHHFPNQTYYSCSCVAGGVSVPGPCPSQCWGSITYVIFLSLGALLGLMASIPGLTVTIRSVGEADRSVAMGFGGTCAALASFVPGPIIYGSVIDSACVFWRSSSCGTQGACMVYDNVSFRYNLHGITAGLKSIAGLFYMTVAILLWKHKRYQHNTDNISESDDKKFREVTGEEKDDTNLYEHLFSASSWAEAKETVI